MDSGENKKRADNKKDAAHSGYALEGNLGRLKRGMYSRLKQPINRNRRELSKIKAVIGGDWEKPDDENDNGKDREAIKKEAVLLTYSQPKQKKKLRIPLIGAIIFSILSFIIAVVYIVGGANTVSPKRVDIKITGPDTIQGGAILPLNISVTNHNDMPLELADLLVFYPDGTRVPTNLASEMTEQRIPLGIIPAGATRDGTVRAAVFGASGSSKTITVELEYRASGSNVLHLAEAKRDILITSNTLDISVNADTETIIGQETNFIVEVTSRSNILLRDVVLESKYPFGFTVEKVDPKPNKGDVFWEIGDLSSGDKYTLHVTGKFDGTSGDERVLRFSAGIREDKSIENVEVELATVEHVMELKQPFLDVRMLFNDLEADDYFAITRETIPVEIYWKNNIDSALTNVVLAASIYGDGVDPYTISADGGFYRSIDSVAIWDKTTTDGVFGSIAASQEGTVLLRITPRVAEQLADKENPDINIEIHTAGQRLSEVGVPEIIESTVKETIKVASDIGLSSRALFHSNPFESSGSLPPKVHQETTYAVVWEVSNTTNKLRDGIVTAILPQYIHWLSIVSPVTENVVYKQSDGTVTWYLGNILPGAGVGENEPRRVAFNIGFIPSAGQVGESPELITDQVLTGFDLFVQSELRKEAEDLTTALLEEEFIYGQDTVQP